MRNEISAKHEAVRRQLRAEALLIAVKWAGSARELGRRIGCSPATSVKWAQRGFIPPLAALQLEKLPGFPLSAEDMAPGAEWGRYVARRCPHCDRRINPLSVRTGSSPMLKARVKRSGKHTPRCASSPTDAR